jgi:regulator of RNase E activity RraA
VLADRDGEILIGAAEVDSVVAAAERKMATEGDMVRAIRAGEDPQAAYLRYRVF